MSDIPVAYYNQNKELKPKWHTEKQCHNEVFAIVNDLDNKQNYRFLQNLRFARLYQNTDMIGFEGKNYAIVNNINIEKRLSLNVVKSCVDTAAAKIAKSKPKPLFLTEDGDFSIKNKSQLLTQYIDATFDNLNIYEIGQKVFVDAAVFGTGAIHFYTENNELKAERVLINEIKVDDSQSIYGSPPDLYRIKYMTRSELTSLYPKYASEIKDASSAMTNAQNSDMIKVIFAWHKPTKIEETDKSIKTDGRYVVCIENATLESHPFLEKEYPFVFLRFSEKLLGFFGTGIAEELVGIQIEINKTLKVIQQSQNLMSVPRIAIEDTNKVPLPILNNEIGSFIKYTGQPPQALNWTAQTSEVYSWIENLYNKAFEITGISRLSAQSQKPAGLNSGVAMRTYQDIESERFQLVGQRYEKMYISATKLLIKLSKELYTTNKTMKIKAKSNAFLKKIKWKDVDMEEDQYMLDVFPTNILPSTPAGKLQTVQELVQAGFVPPDQALALLDFPDIKRFTSLKTAAQDNIEKIMEVITSDGRYIGPEPYMNLELAIQIAQETYNRAKIDNLEESKLQLLRTFMQECQSLLTPIQSPPPDTLSMDGQNPPTPTPQGQPQAPPTSDLMPQAI